MLSTFYGIIKNKKIFSFLRQSKARFKQKGFFLIIVILFDISVSLNLTEKVWYEKLVYENDWI